MTRSSRQGRGRWQALILAALNAQPSAVLVVADVGAEALGRPLTRSEYNALLRAAHQLARVGQIALTRALMTDATGRENWVLLASWPFARPRDWGTPVGTDTTRTLRGSYRDLAARSGQARMTVWRTLRRLQSEKGSGA